MAQKAEGMGTLEAYFQKEDRVNPVRVKRARTPSCWLADYESGRKMHAEASGFFTRRLLDSLEPVWLHFDPLFTLHGDQMAEWQNAFPWSSRRPPPPCSRNYISSVEFNPEGDRLLCAHAAGNIAVLRTDSITDTLCSGDDAKECLEHPSGRSWTGHYLAPLKEMRYFTQAIDRAAFKPSDSSKVVFVGYDFEGVRILDLGRPGAPPELTETVLRTRKRPHSMRSTNAGYTDCVHLPCGSPLRVAAANREAIDAWDDRAGNDRPVLQLRGPNSVNPGPGIPRGLNRLTCLEHSFGGLSIHAGTDSGMIHTWDVRNPNSGTNASSPGHSAPSLSSLARPSSAFTFLTQAPAGAPCSSMSLSYELRRHGHLGVSSSDSAFPTHSVGAVQSLSLNPLNGTQLAVALQGKITCVVDLLQNRLSHVLSPPRTEAHVPVLTGDNRVLHMDTTTRPEGDEVCPELLQQTRRCCWLPEQELLVAPSASSELLFLDLRQKQSTLSTLDSHDASDRLDQKAKPHPCIVRKQVKGPIPVCTAALQSHHLIISGTFPSALSVFHSCAKACKE